VDYFITLDLGRIIVRDYLSSQQSTLWGRSFDIQNNLDAATEFVIDLVIGLVEFAEANSAMYQDLMFSAEELDDEIDNAG